MVVLEVGLVLPGVDDGGAQLDGDALKLLPLLSITSLVRHVDVCLDFGRKKNKKMKAQTKENAQQKGSKRQTAGSFINKHHTTRTTTNNKKQQCQDEPTSGGSPTKYRHSNWTVLVHLLCRRQREAQQREDQRRLRALLQVPPMTSITTLFCR